MAAGVDASVLGPKAESVKFVNIDAFLKENRGRRRFIGSTSRAKMPHLSCPPLGFLRQKLVFAWGTIPYFSHQGRKL
jgi:hypothetical protein